jgi:cation transport regulator ChaC
VARQALFAYGSLVSPGSASRTLGRPVEASAVVRLHGWRRRWSTMRDNLACEKTFARRADGELLGHVLGLNLEPAGDDEDAPNGVLLELSEQELLRLDVREMRYDRVEVTERLERPGGIEEVFTYRAKPAHFAPRPPDGAVVISSYAAFVEAAFDALGPGQRDVYLETTGPPPVEVVDAMLVRDRIPPGNPRDW